MIKKEKLRNLTTGCFSPMIAILQANLANTFKQRTELISKCQRQAKYIPRNRQPNQKHI